MTAKTSFKQPILFQSRVVDLEDFEDSLNSDVLDICKSHGSFSDAHKLVAYELKCDHSEWLALIRIMEEKYNINLEKLKYGKLPRPMALDNRTGDLYQVVSADYNRSGIVTSVIAIKGDTIKYIYNDLPQTAHITGMSYKTELILLYDGWY